MAGDHSHILARHMVVVILVRPQILLVNDQAMVAGGHDEPQTRAMGRISLVNHLGEFSQDLDEDRARQVSNREIVGWEWSNSLAITAERYRPRRRRHTWRTGRRCCLVRVTIGW